MGQKKINFKERPCHFCNSMFLPTNASNKYCSLKCTLYDKIVIDQATGCWNWMGAKSKKNGYGLIRKYGKNVIAHRLSWQINYGKIPKHEGYHGCCVLHKCDNPSCCNPEHLFLGSHTDNMHDMFNKKRRRSYHGEDNPASKLTNDKVISIREDLSNGGTYRGLAKKYGVGQTTIGRIKKGTHWIHI